MYQPIGQPEWHDEQDKIPSYISRLTQTPLLRPDEERKLAQLAKQGDENAKRRLVEANMRLVLNVAKNYRNRSIPFEDLVQEGAIGLMNAVDRFDPEKGFRFSTYATHWIRQTISRAINYKAKPIRLPAHISDAIRKVERVRIDLMSDLGREPTIEEIANYAGISVERLMGLFQCNQDTVSLDVSVGEEDATDLISLIADNKEDSPEAVALHKDMLRQLQTILKDLNERERRVMRKRLGFEEDATLLRELSSDMHLSRERVRQIEIQALKKLRQLAAKRRLKELFSD